MVVVAVAVALAVAGVGGDGGSGGSSTVKKLSHLVVYWYGTVVQCSRSSSSIIRCHQVTSDLEWALTSGKIDFTVINEVVRVPGIALS